MSTQMDININECRNLYALEMYKIERILTYKLNTRSVTDWLHSTMNRALHAVLREDTMKQHRGNRAA